MNSSKFEDGNCGEGGGGGMNSTCSQEATITIRNLNMISMV